jgi:DNA repair photolyase
MLDKRLARTLDPRAAAPHKRLQLIEALAKAGVPVGVLVAPVIPGLTDHELESILEAAAAHGATSAHWIMLRLPREVAPLFRDWLEAHHPLRAAHVMSLVNQVRGGRDNDPRFGARMRGHGEFADVIGKRFALAAKRLHLNESRSALDTTIFRPPRAASPQLDLF